MLLLAAAVLIGNQACRPCHAAIVEAYAQTPMARSSGLVQSPIASAKFKAAGHSYEISKNRLHFEQGSVAFKYFIGSQAAGRSYLWEKDGYLFELPVTWYSHKGIWDASPGYENDRQIRLTRPVEPSCLACHSSRVRPVAGTQNRYGDPPFLENGIACERCHGAGSDHVSNPGKSRMINPSKLPPEARDSVCSQCHLTAEVRIEKAGRKLANFQPGEKLSDYATYFVREQPRQDLKVTSHVEKLAASACKRASGDKLWCATCHDTHTNRDKTQAACLSCHQAAHHPEEQCATCHMPKSMVVDGGHGVLTDHSIPRIRKPSVASSGKDLIAYLGSADDRSLGLAYAETGDPRARALLLRSAAQDSEVLLRLAVLEPDQTQAQTLYEAVLKTNPGQTAALVNLGALYAQQGRVEEAGRLWQRALVANPALEEAVMNLMKIRPTEAQTILGHYLEFNPANETARQLLRPKRN